MTFRMISGSGIDDPRLGVEPNNPAAEFFLFGGTIGKFFADTKALCSPSVSSIALVPKVENGDSAGMSTAMSTRSESSEFRMMRLYTSTRPLAALAFGVAGNAEAVDEAILNEPVGVADARERVPLGSFEI